jgi:hypothetical protein
MDNEKAGTRRGYLPTKKDRDMVRTMSGHGIKQLEIATVLNIDLKTLRKYFREELDTGAISAVAEMSQNLWKKAMGDGPASVTATIFWLKARGGWREASATSENDTTLTIKVVGGLPESSS